MNPVTRTFEFLMTPDDYLKIIESKKKYSADVEKYKKPGTAHGDPTSMMFWATFGGNRIYEWCPGTLEKKVHRIFLGERVLFVAGLVASVLSLYYSTNMLETFCFAGGATGLAMGIRDNLNNQFAQQLALREIKKNLLAPKVTRLIQVR
jgi:hypothetical protein